MQFNIKIHWTFSSLVVCCSITIYMLLNILKSYILKQYYNAHKTKTTAIFKYPQINQLKGSVKEPNISIYFFFLPITQWWSVYWWQVSVRF